MRYLLLIVFQWMVMLTFAQQAKIHDLSAADFAIGLDTCPEKLVLDTRPDSFAQKFCIEGAVIANDKTTLLAILDTLDRELPLFVYCVEGVKSSSVCKIVQEKGFQYIYNLKRGVNNYRRKGYPVIVF